MFSTSCTIRFLSSSTLTGRLSPVGRRHRRRLVGRRPVDGRLNRDIGREDRNRYLGLNKQTRPGVRRRCRLRFKRRLRRTLDSLVVRVFRHSPGHSRATDLRQVQFPAHPRCVRERFLILGQHRVLNGRWRLVSIVAGDLRSFRRRCLRFKRLSQYICSIFDF